MNNKIKKIVNEIENFSLEDVQELTSKLSAIELSKMKVASKSLLEKRKFLVGKVLTNGYDYYIVQRIEETSSEQVIPAYVEKFYINKDCVYTTTPEVYHFGVEEIGKYWKIISNKNFLNKLNKQAKAVLEKANKIVGKK